MKNLSILFAILASGLLFSCKSNSGNDLFVQGIMKNRMNNLSHTKYTENKNGDTTIFEVADKGYSLKGTYSQVADYKLVTLFETDNAYSRYLSAIFANEGGAWQSVFENELEDGKLGTIKDLNKDNVNEIILQFYEHVVSGYESKLGLYSRKGSEKYKQIGFVAPNYYRGNAYNILTSTVELLQVGDYTWLFVKTLETGKENGEPIQKKSDILYIITTLGELETLYANLLILNSDPLIFKYQQDNLWGIYSRDGDEIKSTPLNFMNGFSDMLTISGKTKEILPPEYTEILSASEGLIPVKNKEDSWGFVNMNGEWVIDCKYNGVSKFENGRAVVKIPGDTAWRKAYYIIDNKGNEQGLFFDKIEGNNCVEARLTMSDESGEKYSEYSLSNCPDGVMSEHYSGWEWSSGKAFYPGGNRRYYLPVCG
jgi:hypothetical protein